MLPEGFELESRDRPAYLRFETSFIEDRAATMREGRYMTKQVDIAHVTPVGSKDEIPKFIDDWFPVLAHQGRHNQSIARLLRTYKEQYAAWKEGQEIPISGTPVKTCPIFSPAEVQQCLNANIRTLEDILNAPAEATKRIGMYAATIKAKAEHYLKSADTGKAAQEILVIRGENDSLRAQMEEMKKIQDQLLGMMERKPVIPHKGWPKGKPRGVAKIPSIPSIPGAATRVYAPSEGTP